MTAANAGGAAPSAAALRTLIREVGERGNQWNVVASIREYDARYSRDLAVIFKGTPPDGPVPPLIGASFAGVRHIVVGRLTDDELQQIGDLGAPELAQLLESASTRPISCLFHPFDRPAQTCGRRAPSAPAVRPVLRRWPGLPGAR